MDGFVCFAEAKGNWTADEIGYAARQLVLSDPLFQEARGVGGGDRKRKAW